MYRVGNVGKTKDIPHTLKMYLTDVQVMKSRVPLESKTYFCNEVMI